MADLAGPAYKWWYGCSPTSAGMMMGYYDIHGYGGNSYANLVPGGVAEAYTANAGTSGWSYLVNPIIASQGFVNDYYRNTSGAADMTNGGTDAGYYMNSRDDVQGAAAYNCLSYYMGTSRDAYNNPNGSTTFYYDTSGAKVYAKDVIGLPDGMLGMDLYFRACGYGTGLIDNDMTFFTQHIYDSTHPAGFTFANYKAEIDNGRVMMIQVEGHSMFGYGYREDGSQQYILLSDTWDNQEHSMLWGSSYAGRLQWGVVGFDPTGGSPVPVPGAVWLVGSGLLGLWGAGRRWRKP